MDRYPVMSRIKLQRAQASNYRYASRRRYPRDRQQALNYNRVYNRVKITTLA